MENALVMNVYAIRSHALVAVLVGWRKADPRYLMKGRKRLYRLQHLHTRRESQSHNSLGKWVLHLILHWGNVACFV